VELPCREISLIKVAWPILRISRKFSKVLLIYLNVPLANLGHHETLLPAICKLESYQQDDNGAPNCTLAQYSAENVGYFHMNTQLLCRSESTINAMEKVYAGFHNGSKLPPNRLYHPVKCALKGLDNQCLEIVKRRNNIPEKRYAEWKDGSRGQRQLQPTTAIT
jgi:hypothetical protein